MCAQLCIHCAPAQSAPSETEAETEGIVVYGHHDNRVGTSDAASQGTITPKLIEDRPSLRPGEILEFVPGVIVTQHSGDGKANQYYLRGFNLDHGTDFATFVAGMPANMRSHAHGQGYTDLNFLIPELVSRISYRKGPYFAEDGDFANAGSARIDYVSELKQPFASASVGENQFLRLLTAGSISAGPGTLLGALEIGHNNGPWTVPEGFGKLNGVLRWSMAAGNDRLSVTGMAYASKWTSTDQIPLRAVSGGSLGRFDAIDPTDGGKTSRASLSVDWTRAIGSGALQVNAYTIRSRLDLYNNFTYRLDDPVNGDQFHQSEQRGVTGLSVTRSWAADLGDAEMVNKLGLQARYDRVDPLTLELTAQRRTLSTTRRDAVREGSLGLFAENSVQWLPWLRSVAGLRLDRYAFSVNSDNPANSGKVSAHITSPKMALILGPWANTEFFLNYGEGFHSNDARGTTTRASPTTGLPVVPVTPLAKSKGSELGMRTEPFPGLVSSLALWELRLASELVFSGDAGDTQASRASVRHGIEWSNHWALRPWLLLDFDLSASRARFTQDDPAGNFIPGSVDRVAALGLSIPNRGGWFGALQWRYFGPRPLIEDNSQRSASTLIAYLRAGRQIDRNVRVSVDVLNLFNRKASDTDYFYTSRLAGEPGAGVSDFHFHPVEPRMVRTTLLVRF